MNDSAANLILIAEDDKKTSNLLVTYLQRDGFSTAVAFDGQQALDVFHASQPQLLILDIMLPLVDGWEVCRAVRAKSNTPILFLTARDEEADRVLGLGLGGDDYVVKPFSPREVVARVKAILRRTVATIVPPIPTRSHAGLVLNLEKRRVALNGSPVALTPIEYSLLKTLMTAPGRVFSREELVEQFYPDGEIVVDRVVDVHIGKLRQKIETDPARPELILTVRGIGYQFADQEHPAP